MVRQMELESMTYRLKGGCSDQLSYWRINNEFTLPLYLFSERLSLKPHIIESAKISMPVVV